MKVPNTEANMKRCICGDCPTFVKGDKGLFCALGASDLELTDKGCICGACPLWDDYSLTDGYFCLEGAAD